MYQTVLMAYSPKQFPHDEIVRTRNVKDGRVLQHISTVLVKMPVFLDEGRIEKVHRWLGFVQGVLWIMGFYSLMDRIDHNRTD